jgi:hypothetical protein
MENANVVPQKLLDTDSRQAGDRRKENNLLTIQDRRAGEWRRAADRADRAGNSIAAQLFRNEACFVEAEFTPAGKPTL